MGVVSMKQLLEAGVHFGHQTRRWNPKMAPYIFTERNGIYIIDLQKTVTKLDEAYAFVRDLSASGESVLFVGTKKQAGDSVKEEALRAGAHYVNARWLGGMMTNFKTIQRRIKRLEQLHQMAEDPKMASKPEQVRAKIAEGKVGKYYSENCLLEQAFVKDDKVTVGKYVENAAKQLGGKIAVSEFVRFERGEGIEKKEENFADEVAKMIK